jgi:hypothetical protein
VCLPKRDNRCRLQTGATAMIVQGLYAVREPSTLAQALTRVNDPWLPAETRACAGPPPKAERMSQ